MLGSFIIYLKGMRLVMFQLSSFYCKRNSPGFVFVGFTGVDPCPGLVMLKWKAQHQPCPF